MKEQTTISYEWWNVEFEEIPKNHKEQLKEHAINRALKMAKDGYHSGQLIETIIENDKEIDYEGWWKINTESIDNE